MKKYQSSINIWIRENPWKGENEENYCKQHLARYIDTLNIVKKYVPTDKNILSIGCDPGHIEFLMVNAGYRDITGISCNIAVPLINRMKGLGINLYDCDIENAALPFADSSFDAVLFLEVLEHLFLNPMHAIKEIIRVLKPGGTIVLSTPNIAQFRNRMRFLKGKSINWPLHGPKAFFERHISDRHNREYTASEVGCLMSPGGLRTEKIIFRDYSKRLLMKIFNSLRPTFKSTQYHIIKKPVL